MAHINKIGFENYKVFKDKTEFELAPITIFTGTNSSGKTAVLKFLGLLMKSFKEDIFSELNFFDPTFFLGDFNSVKNYSSKKEFVSFYLNNWRFKYVSDKTFDNENFACLDELQLIGNDNEPLFGFIDKMGYPNNHWYELHCNHSKAIDFLYQNKDITEKEHLMLTTINESNELKFSIGTGMKIVNEEGRSGINAHEWIDILKNVCNYETFEINLNDSNGVQLANSIKEQNNDLIERLFNKDEHEKVYLFLQRYISIINKYIYDFLIKIPDSIKYLGSFRGMSKRLYESYSSEDDMGKLLLDYYRLYKHFEIDGVWHPINVDDEENIFLEKWCREFNIGKWSYDSIRRIENLGFKIEFDKNNSKVELSNLGFGYTQLFPIILKTIYPNSNNRFIIEEPESHLHPKNQSKLADFFVDAFKTFYQNFIVETHSEYLIRKFQYLVAKGELKPENIIIYYLNDPDETKRPEGVPQVQKIEINKNGSLSQEFGTGFFDESARLIGEIISIAFRKIKISSPIANTGIL